MAPHLEVNKLELFVQCPLRINMIFTTSIYAIVFNNEVMKLPLHQEGQSRVLAPVPSLLTQAGLLCNLRVPQGVPPSTTSPGHLNSHKGNISWSSLNPHPKTALCQTLGSPHPYRQAPPSHHKQWGSQPVVHPLQFKGRAKVSLCYERLNGKLLPGLSEDHVTTLSRAN